jgi:alanine-alpha-ketoisovalerate/valine-pyruvate aminotransferase
MSLQLGPQKMNKKCGNSKTAKPVTVTVLYIRMAILLNKNSTCEMTSSNINKTNGSKKFYSYLKNYT